MFAFPLRHFIRFLWHSILVIRAITWNLAGNEDACKYVILMFIAVLSRLFQDWRRFQQRLRLLAIWSRRRRIKACFYQRMLEDVNVGHKEICLGFSVTTVSVRKHGSQSIWRQPLAWAFSGFKRNLLIYLWSCWPPSRMPGHKHASSNSCSETCWCCFVAPCNREFVLNNWTGIWCREMHSIKTKRRILFSPVKSR